MCFSMRTVQVMKKRNKLVWLFLLLFTFSFASSQTTQPFPPTTPDALFPQRIIVPPQFRGLIDTNLTLNLPQGFSISVFAIGSLGKPRFLEFDTNGVLHVADMYNRAIIAMPDNNLDGVADRMTVVATQIDSAHSLAFHNGDLYVPEPTGVLRFRDLNRDGVYETVEPFITGIHSTGVYNHFTRTILFDEKEGFIYLSIGASCNACREENSERASILRFNLDGSGRKIFATGIRNALGLAIEPATHRLWAANADRDNQGDEIPEEIITTVREGGFYGWPLAYGHRQWVDFNRAPEYQAMLPIAHDDSVKVALMEIAEAYLPAHITPMAILFYQRTQFSEPYRSSAFIALHGSSRGGRAIGRGYKVIRMWKDGATGRWNTTDFITGFLTDSINYKFFGRPCGLTQDAEGNLYLSSDRGIAAVYKISYDRSLVGVGNEPSLPQEIALSVYPNPLSASTTIRFRFSSFDFSTNDERFHVEENGSSMNTKQGSQFSLKILDLLGREVNDLNDRIRLNELLQEIQLDARSLKAGMYLIQLRTPHRTLIKKLFIAR